MAKYLIKTGLNLPTGKRYEPGQEAEDIPAADIKWLREQGHIELIESNAPTGGSEAEGGDG